jgi:AbiU2
MSSQTNLQESPSKLRRLVDAVSHDHMTALQALGIVRLLSASAECCKRTLDHNDFLRAVHDVAHDTLFMALSRMFDGDNKTAGIVGICEYAKKHPEECPWLYQRNEAEGSQGVQALSDRWLTWRKTLPFTHSLTMLRNNHLAHRGMKPWLGQSPEISISWSEITDALHKTDEMVNEFLKGIENSEIMHSSIYEQVIFHGAFTFAAAEANIEESINDPVRRSRRSEIRDCIQRRDKEQITDNKWQL